MKSPSTNIQFFFPYKSCPCWFSNLSILGVLRDTKKVSNVWIIHPLNVICNFVGKKKSNETICSPTGFPLCSQCLFPLLFPLGSMQLKLAGECWAGISHLVPLPKDLHFEICIAKPAPTTTTRKKNNLSFKWQCNFQLRKILMAQKTDLKKCSYRSISRLLFKAPTSDVKYFALF